MASARKSDRLFGKIGIAGQRLRAALAALWGHPDLGELYPRALVSAYTIMRASVPLMERARDKARECARDSDVCEALVAYFDRHVVEERGHEEWLLDDLEALGFARDDVVGCLPSPTSAALVGAQYYWIDHVHPIALLGHIAVMECDPPSEQDIEKAIEHSGLSKDAFTNLVRHARLDPHHRDEFCAAIDAMEMSEREWDIVGVSAVQAVNLYADVVEETVRFGVAGPMSILMGRRSNRRPGHSSRRV